MGGANRFLDHDKKVKESKEVRDTILHVKDNLTKPNPEKGPRIAKATPVNDKLDKKRKEAQRLELLAADRQLEEAKKKKFERRSSTPQKPKPGIETVESKRRKLYELFKLMDDLKALRIGPGYYHDSDESKGDKGVCMVDYNKKNHSVSPTKKLRMG